MAEPPTTHATAATNSPTITGQHSSELDITNLSPDLQKVVQTYVTQALKEGRKHKRTKKDDLDDTDEEASSRRKDYSDYGRACARLIEPFTKIHNIVEHGLLVEAADSEDEQEESPESKRQTESWKILCNLIPGFKEQMIAAAKERTLRRGVCKQISRGVEDVRSDDTSGFKDSIIGFLLQDVSAPLVPPILPKYLLKVVRGWNHPVTAALLMPIELPANDTTYADIKAGRVRVTADQWPRFLYPDGHVYNADDEEIGLLRGHLMIRCAKYLFTGPSSALHGPGWTRGKSNNAKIIGMKKVTPRAIAYVAIQVRFALSDVQEWSDTDRDFDCQKFFWNIVSVFDDGEGADILAFFNHELFGVQTIPLVRDVQNVQLSFTDRLRAQRAAKRARTAQVVQHSDIGNV